MGCLGKSSVSINNPQLFMEGFWDWGILDGCFGETRIKPTDIDGFVERNGNFLVLETKKQGVKIEYGQQKTFNELLLTGKFTVLVIWGQKDKPEALKLYSPFLPQKYKAGKYSDNISLSDLRNSVWWWFCKADGKE